MTRRQLLGRLDRAWRDFTDSYAGLTPSELLEPGVTKGWSARDIIAHVTWWEEEALTHLPLVLRGETPPRYSVTYGGIDAFNAMMTDKKKDLSLAEVLAEHADTHRRLLEYLERVPDDQLTTETRFRHRLRLDTYGHYPKHAKAIRQWRAKHR
jgi:DinB superfamily